MRRVSSWPCLAFVSVICLLNVAGCTPDPSTPAHWEKRFSDAKSKKERRRVVEDLRGSKHLSPAMYPLLYKRLEVEKSSEVKGDIARLLGEKVDTGAVPALLAAADYAPADGDAKTMNREIAIALGRLKDAKAAPTLVKLLETRDSFTVVASIEALGQLKAKEAFEPLQKLVVDEATEPFITAKAIVALGDIGDARAVGELVKFMFKQRRGVDFYKDASFALFQLGTPAAEALLPVLEGRDKALKAWAAKDGIAPEALTTKAAQVLADVREERGVPAMLDYLKYKHKDPGIKLLVQMRMAEALGRLRAKAAVEPIIGLLVEREGSAYELFVSAFARIGDPAPVPKLLENAPKGSWDVRQEAIRGVALLGSAGDASALQQLEAAEPATFEAECKSEEIGGHDDCRDVKGNAVKHQSYIAQARKALEAADSCKSDAPCWVKKLDDPSPLVRERAAFAVGRSGNAPFAVELVKRTRERELGPRLAIIQGADWLVHELPDAKKAAAELLPELQKQLAEERGKKQFELVNEDLRRLAFRISKS